MNSGAWAIGGVGVIAVGGIVWWIFKGSQSKDGDIEEVNVTQEKVSVVPSAPTYLAVTSRRSSPPKSVRNNNPTNLRTIRTNPFDGQTGDDNGYGVYSTVLLGARAAFKNLRNYFTRDGLDTVREIVTKWAPASDNNPTASYVTFVASQLGVSPDQALTYQVHARSLIKAMARFEAGYQPYVDQLYADAYQAAA